MVGEVEAGASAALRVHSGQARYRSNEGGRFLAHGKRPADVGTFALQNGERPAGVSAAALREACEEFEALFVSMLFRSMRSTVPREGLLSGGSAGEIFDSMWAEEVGRAVARSGPLGIGKMLLGALGGDGEVAGGSSEGRGLPKREMEAAGGVRRPGRRMR